MLSTVSSDTDHFVIVLCCNSERNIGFHSIFINKPRSSLPVKEKEASERKHYYERGIVLEILAF
jgi:hypothetical protein